MGLILELPLPTVRMNGVQRKDLRLDHGRKTPETLEELVAEAEYYHGKDLNGDGIPDKVQYCVSLFGIKVCPLYCGACTGTRSSRGTCTPNILFMFSGQPTASQIRYCLSLLITRGSVVMYQVSGSISKWYKLF